MTNEIEFFKKFSFSLEIFFYEMNNEKLVVDNAVSEETVENIATSCQHINLSISRDIAGFVLV